MVSETTPVNRKQSKDLNTFGGRLSAERERLKLKQVDICIRTGVSKTTQIKYEASERKPDTEYLALIDAIGFDVMYIISGERSSSAPMAPEHQNLLDAYEAAPEALRKAVFAVLLSPYKNEWGKARSIPGYFQHEILGEDDARYQKLTVDERWGVAVEETKPADDDSTGK